MVSWYPCPGHPSRYPGTPRPVPRSP